MECQPVAFTNVGAGPIEYDIRIYHTAAAFLEIYAAFGLFCALCFTADGDASKAKALETLLF